MASFEARKGGWSVFTDVIYLDLAGDESKSVALPGGRFSPIVTGVPTTCCETSGRARPGRAFAAPWHWRPATVPASCRASAETRV